MVLSVGLVAVALIVLVEAQEQQAKDLLEVTVQGLQRTQGVAVADQVQLVKVLLTGQPEVMAVQVQVLQFLDLL